MKFNSPDQVIADVDQLRARPHHKLGNWTLPQVCRHLAVVIDGNLTPPPTDEPTPEQIAMKQKFFGMVLGPAGMPDNMPAGPAVLPPDTCGDEAIDHLKAAFKALSEHTHRCILVGRCGPVLTAEVLQLHLAHAAHHLGFLVPKNERRQLRFPNFEALVADVQNLRKGYVTCGNWTLPQACRHMTIAIHRTGTPSTAPATPEQLERRPFFEQLMNGGSLPSGIPAAEAMIPPPDCTDADIDAFIAALDIAQTYAQPTATHRLFGPLTPEQFRKLTLAHCAHHLSHFAPTTN